jgi:hypothetical protein
MKALEAILKERIFDRELSYTKELAVAFQPGAFTDFGQHPEFHEAFSRFTREDAYRGMDIVRIWSLLLNAKYALSRCDGALAELGVYKGQCSAFLSLFAERFDRKMYLLDTFEGFNESQFEKDMGEGQIAAFKDTSLEDAQRVVGDYSGNRWIVGMFPDSVTDEMRAETYAVVSIDCDIYQPILDGLEFFWPRLANNGVIFVHDYSSGHWPGATKAVDEFCEANRLRPILLSDLSGSCILTRF